MSRGEVVIYGAQCSWFGKFGENSNLGGPLGLPCCPHCKGVLLQMDKVEWDRDVANYTQRPGNEDYPKFLTWAKAQGRCWPTFKLARKAFDDFEGERSEG